MGLLLLSTPALADGFQVKDIKIEGLHRISAGTVFSYLPIQVGDTYDGQSTKIIDALYQTGFFKNIELLKQDDSLVIKVVERPAIDEIKIHGNKLIETKQLQESLKQVGISRGRTFNRAVLDRLKSELQQVYLSRGKYDVRIKTSVKDLPRNRVSIDIDIHEGATAKIKRINIVGNHYYSEDDIKNELETSEGSLFSFITGSNDYSKQKLAGDLERIKSLYLDHGFINFNINSTQVSLTPDKKDIYITINVDEGDQYRVSSVGFAGDTIVPVKELQAMSTIKPGEIFSRKKINDLIEKIEERLGNYGYAFATVNPIPTIDKKNKTVAVTLYVDPGRRVYVNRITFHGNYKTQDVVLRREMRQMEGAWYDRAQIKRSKTRLQRLSYIESANVKTVRIPGRDDAVNLVVDVKERLASSFSAGIGYSDSEGVIFNTSLSFGNFRGTGKNVAVSVNTSKVNTVYSLSYTNPYYTLNGISRGFSVYYRTIDAAAAGVTTYSADRYGGNLNYGVPLSEFDNFNFGVGLQNTKVKTGTNASTQVQDYLRTNGNEFNEYLINVGYTHDSRNRTVFANSGLLSTTGLSVALPGSDLEYYKLSLYNTYHYPLSDKTSLFAKGNIGYGKGYGKTTTLPFFEKYYAGGVGTVRGYKDNSLGPLDSNGDPYGGDLRTTFSTGLLFPVPFSQKLDSVRMSAFFDAGNVFAKPKDFEFNQLRTSAGIGLIWLSPIGPLNFSFASALNAKPGDHTQSFQFTIGTQF
jgi:outer membrane protein insertion porin family